MGPPAVPNVRGQFDVLPSVTELGMTAQVDPPSVLLQVRETVPAKPFTGVAISAYEAPLPGGMVADEGETENAKSFTVSLKL